MTRGRLGLLAAALAGLGGCANGPHGRLNVLLSGGEGSEQEGRLVQAVQVAAGTDGLLCRPETGSTLLRCAPAGLGNPGNTVTVVLSRIGSGYEVAIDQVWTLGRDPAACSTQRRLASAIRSELGTAVVRITPGGDCKD